MRLLLSFVLFSRGLDNAESTQRANAKGWRSVCHCCFRQLGCFAGLLQERENGDAKHLGRGPSRAYGRSAVDLEVWAAERDDPVALHAGSNRLHLWPHRRRAGLEIDGGCSQPRKRTARLAEFPAS